MIQPLFPLNGSNNANIYATVRFLEHPLATHPNEIFYVPPSACLRLLGFIQTEKFYFRVGLGGSVPIQFEHSPVLSYHLLLLTLLEDFIMKQNRCLEAKRCVSMPSVSLTSSSSTSLQHRSRLLRLQDRRFRHRFSEVPQDEKLLNYFSCALVSDILLQGHLFITQNYFAFYSNIFGHKTKILINVSDVVKVTKEKIAKIIPNAVGVYTDSEKYVFGSMLSRDSAFRIIQQTWIQSTDPGLGLPDDSDSEVSPAIMLLADEDSSVSSGLSSHLLTDEMPASASEFAATPEVEAIERMAEAPPTFIKSPAPPKPLPSRCKLDYFKGYVYKVEDMVKELSQLSRISLIFMFSTFLLVLLFLSTAVLLYRIHLLHQKLLAKDEITISNIPRLGEISDIVPSEFSIVVSNLEERIRSLAEVRITLEKLLAMANKFQVPNR